MTRIRIFLSFDGDYDTDLEGRLDAHSRQPSSAFELSARSQRGAMTEEWSASCRSRIRAADEVVVICGEHTNASPHVAAELRIAQEEGKPYLLLWGRRETMCTKPEGAKPSDAMYIWSRDVLESEMKALLRKAEPVVIPERYKRPGP